ncbi:MAG: 50S ribosomal protein L25 [Parcubacteria group bacterium]
MSYELKAKSRTDFGRKAYKFRAAGQTPAVVYGPEEKEGKSIFLNSGEFNKVFEKAGESALINLSIEGEKAPRETLVKDVAYDPLKGNAIHVDFYQVKKGQKLELEVTLKFVGEAPAVKEFGAILVKSLHAVKVRCLPKDIVSEINVDLSSLKAFDARIHISDLPIPEGVEILQDKNDVVAVVKEPEKEEEVKPAGETVAMPEVAGKAKEGEVATGVADAKSEDKKAEKK